MRRVLGVVLLLAIAPTTASADPSVEDRRAYDAWSFWTREFDAAALPNGFTVQLFGRPSYPAHPNGDHTAEISRLEVVTRTPHPDGSTTTRTFAADVAGPDGFLEGRGGFRLGPCFDCTHDGGVLFFALPLDFAGSATIVDVHVELPQAEGDCGTAAPFTPCGGIARGYHNPSFGYPFWLGDQDAADAVPWPTMLV